MRRTLTTCTLLFASFALLATGCEAADDEGPPLPPAESMDMGLATFPTANGPAKADHGQLDGQHTNITNAALRVGFLNTAVWLHLVAPIAVFRVALSQPASFSGGVRTWDFAADGADDEHFEAVLTGWFDGNLQEGTNLTLEMHVTCTACNPALDNYKWYTGHFNSEELGGQWIFHAPEVETTTQEVVQIDYDVTDAQHRSLTFLNVRGDDHENAGDEIAYIRDGDAARATVHDADDAGAPLDYAAEWNIADGSGYIEVPGYNEGNRACWDADQLNVDCP